MDSLIKIVRVIIFSYTYPFSSIYISDTVPYSTIVCFCLNSHLPKQGKAINHTHQMYKRKYHNWAFYDTYILFTSNKDKNIILVKGAENLFLKKNSRDLQLKQYLCNTPNQPRTFLISQPHFGLACCVNLGWAGRIYNSM